MDLFKLGLRNILGITLPGAVLVLVIFYALYVCAIALNQRLDGVQWIADAEFITLIGAFLLSYVLGGIMRLNSAGNVDEKSSKYHRWEYIYGLGKTAFREATGSKRIKLYFIRYWTYFRHFIRGKDLPKEKDESRFIKALEKNWASRRRGILSLKSAGFGFKDAIQRLSSEKDFDNWIWRAEKFPYPVLRFRRLKEFYPPEVFNFFADNAYRSSVLSGEERQVFLNYCKMVVYRASKELGETLVLEVNRAEATMRFFAGTYYAFLTSSSILLGTLAVQVFVLTVRFPQSLADAGLLAFIEDYRVINIVLTVLLGLAVFAMRRMILKRYRTLRIREVDIVHDAFYLVHQNASSESKETAEQGRSSQEPSGMPL